MHSEWVQIIEKELSAAKAELCEREIGDKFIYVESSNLYDVCKLLKESVETSFNVLQVITGTDYEDRIEVSYILASFEKNTELILKIKLPRENPNVKSVVPLWEAANFQERECFDMLGVKFVGHPDLRRILCPDDWEGYPLRKDYVAAKMYNGMEINPESKMNWDDRQFEENLKAKTRN